MVTCCASRTQLSRQMALHGKQAFRHGDDHSVYLGVTGDSDDGDDEVVTPGVTYLNAQQLSSTGGLPSILRDQGPIGAIEPEERARAREP